MVIPDSFETHNLGPQEMTCDHNGSKYRDDKLVRLSSFFSQPLFCFVQTTALIFEPFHPSKKIWLKHMSSTRTSTKINIPLSRTMTTDTPQHHQRRRKRSRLLTAPWEPQAMCARHSIQQLAAPSFQSTMDTRKARHSTRISKRQMVSCI